MDKGVTVWWLPSKHGKWLTWDEELGDIVVVPNRRGGWAQRKRYASAVLPDQRHALPSALAKIVVAVTGIPSRTLEVAG